MIRFSPREVDDMSIWQWQAVVNGWNAAHTPDDGTLDDAEIEDLGAFIEG